MMHGRKKIPKRQLTSQQKQQKSQKLQKIKQLNSKLIALRKKKDLHESRLIISEKAAFLSPDWTTLWNYRRQILANIFDSKLQEKVQKPEQSQISTDQQGEKSYQELGDKQTLHASKCYSMMLKQLGFLNKLLKISPKSYTLWFQRQWILLRAFKIELILDSYQRTKKQNKHVLIQEQGLCQMMLSRDDRNFHCWNYKSWLLDQEIQCLKMKYTINEQEAIKQINTVLDREIDYGTELINKNFSNFSAWFFRSKVFKQRFPDGLSQQLIKSELKLLKSAYFTEPKDQSPWQYHKWILGQVIPIYVRVMRGSFTLQVVSANEELEGQNIKTKIQLSDYISSISLQNILDSEYKIEDNLQNNNKLIKSLTITQKNESKQIVFKTSKVQTLTGLHNFRGCEIKKDKIYQSEDKFLAEIINQEMKSVSQLIELDNSLQYAQKRYVQLSNDFLNIISQIDGHQIRKQAIAKLEDLANVINPRFKQFYISFKDKFLK